MARGRKPIGERAMTAAERKRRQRRIQKEEISDPINIKRPASELIKDAENLLEEINRIVEKSKQVLSKLAG